MFIWERQEKPWKEGDWLNLLSVIFKVGHSDFFTTNELIGSRATIPTGAKGNTWRVAPPHSESQCSTKPVPKQVGSRHGTLLQMSTCVFSADHCPFFNDQMLPRCDKTDRVAASTLQPPFLSELAVAYSYNFKSKWLNIKHTALLIFTDQS